MQIPAGWLVDRFDVKWVFAVGFFVWSAATAMTGILHGFAALIVIRVILGLGRVGCFSFVLENPGHLLHGATPRLCQRDYDGRAFVWGRRLECWWEE